MRGLPSLSTQYTRYFPHCFGGLSYIAWITIDAELVLPDYSSLGYIFIIIQTRPMGKFEFVWWDLRPFRRYPNSQ
jgi:hypothetical protein